MKIKKECYDCRSYVSTGKHYYKCMVRGSCPAYDKPKMILLEKDNKRMEYFEVTINIPVRIYTAQEDFHPFISTDEARLRIKKYLRTAKGIAEIALQLKNIKDNQIKLTGL